MNSDPSLPGQHGALIDGKGNATVPFRRWLERVQNLLLSTSTTATEAAAAAAAIPAATDPTVIHPSASIDVLGDAASGYTLVVTPSALPAASSSPVWMLQDCDCPEPMMIPGPKGDTGAAGGGGGGAMTLVGTATVAGAAATSLTMSGLDLGTDGSYYLQVCTDNATASAGTIALFYNADTTAGNYWNQIKYATGATAAGARQNNAECAQFDANETVTATITIFKDRDGKPRAFVETNRGAPSGIIDFGYRHAWTSTANVTSITLTSSVASAFSIGTYFKVWKIN